MYPAGDPIIQTFLMDQEIFDGSRLTQPLNKILDK